MWFPFSLSKGCDLIEDGVGQYEYKRNTQLKVSRVNDGNNGPYTCFVMFTLGGVAGTMSETIKAWVSSKDEEKETELARPCFRCFYVGRACVFCVTDKLTCRVSVLPPSSGVLPGTANTRTNW